MRYSHIVIFYLVILSIHSENSFVFKNITDIKRKLDETALDLDDVLEILSRLLGNVFPECKEDINTIQPKSVKVSFSKLPFVIDDIGKSQNDLGDEIECRNAFYDTIYAIAELNVDNIINESEEDLTKFLNLTKFALGACLTQNCKEPLKEFIKIFLNLHNDTKEVLYEDPYAYVEENNYKIIIIWIALVYVLFKIVAGVCKLGCFPKGYNEEAFVRINKIKKKDNDDIDDEDKNDQLLLDESDEEYDYSTVLLKLRILRFFDCFNDIMLLSKKRNRYFNDSGLEIINFVRAIVLYFIIFYNTFTSLIELPSKDILNKSFFTSKIIFIYRLSIHSLSCWIFLEAACTTFKLMKFIKNQMKEYKIEDQSSCEYYAHLLLIYLKFICLFIPKIIMFLFFYLFFYKDIIKFKYFFDAKTTFSFVHDKVIMNHKENNTIFFNPFLYTFTTNITNTDFNECYDFTLVYFNILFSTIIFMIILYIMFLFKSKIVEIFFIFANIGLFFGLMFIVDNDNISITENKKYTYYHFKGQEYTTKIAYLSIGVYHLGFIIGLLCFNYDNIKDEETNINKDDKKDYLINDNENDILIREKEKRDSGVNEDDVFQNRNSSKISGNTRKSRNSASSQNFDIYCPLSFFNCLLKVLKNMSSKIKGFIILFCIILMILLSLAYKIIGREGDDSLDELNLKFNKMTKYYYLFERHIFLILFFVINLIMITSKKEGPNLGSFFLQKNGAADRT